MQKLHYRYLTSLGSLVGWLSITLSKSWEHDFSRRGPYSKTCVKRPLSKRPLIGFQDQLSLNAGQKYYSILQYIRPSLSYHLLLKGTATLL